MKNRKEIEDTKSGITFFKPAVDIYNEEDKIILFADMPGIKKEDLDIDIERDVLVISGVVKNADEKNKKNESNVKYYFKEFDQLNYRREFVIKDIATDQVTAEFINGVLKLILPVKEEVKPKKIAIL